MESPRYVRWLIEETNIKLSDGTHIPCYRLEHTKDEDVLNEWALHLRRHYESDESLRNSMAQLGISASDYLRDYVLPGSGRLGASCRSGDFTEILVSDLLEFIQHYKVPRCKQQNRANKDSSTQGTDVIGYYYANADGKASPNDELVTAEVKAGLSTSTYKPLKKAADDSQKDEFRWATTLNYYRLHFHNKGDTCQYIENMASPVAGTVEKISRIPTPDANSVEAQYAVYITVEDASSFYYGMNVIVTTGGNN